MEKTNTDVRGRGRGTAIIAMGLGGHQVQDWKRLKKERRERLSDNLVQSLLAGVIRKTDSLRSRQKDVRKREIHAMNSRLCPFNPL